MATVQNAPDNVQPTDADIAASLARIDAVIAVIEAGLAEHSSDLKAMKTARARRDIGDTISFIFALTWVVAVVALAIYGTTAALGGAR